MYQFKFIAIILLLCYGIANAQTDSAQLAGVKESLHKKVISLGLNDLSPLHSISIVTRPEGVVCANQTLFLSAYSPDSDQLTKYEWNIEGNEQYGKQIVYNVGSYRFLPLIIEITAKDRNKRSDKATTLIEEVQNSMRAIIEPLTDTLGTGKNVVTLSVINTALSRPSDFITWFNYDSCARSRADKTILGAGKTFTVSQPGWYYAQLKDMYGCEAEAGPAVIGSKRSKAK